MKEALDCRVQFQNLLAIAIGIARSQPRARSLQHSQGKKAALGIRQKTRQQKNAADLSSYGGKFTLYGSNFFFPIKRQINNQQNNVFFLK